MQHRCMARNLDEEGTVLQEWEFQRGFCNPELQWAILLTILVRMNAYCVHEDHACRTIVPGIYDPALSLSLIAY